MRAGAEVIYQGCFVDGCRSSTKATEALRSRKPTGSPPNSSCSSGHVHRPRRPRAAARLGRRARRHSLQRPGAVPAIATWTSGTASAPSTSSRARRRRSSSSRWRPRAATTCRGTSSSSSRATGSTSRSRARSRLRCSSRARSCSRPLPHHRADADGERPLPVRRSSPRQRATREKRSRLQLRPLSPTYESGTIQLPVLCGSRALVERSRQSRAQPG